MRLDVLLEVVGGRASFAALFLRSARDILQQARDDAILSAEIPIADGLHIPGGDRRTKLFFEGCLQVYESDRIHRWTQ